MAKQAISGTAPVSVREDEVDFLTELNEMIEGVEDQNGEYEPDEDVFVEVQDSGLQMVSEFQDVDLDTLEAKGANLRMSVLSFIDGDKIRLVFMGHSLAPCVDMDTGEAKPPAPVVVFYCPKEKQFKICYSTVLVGIFNQKNVEVGKAYEIVYKGMVKATNSSRKFKDFSVVQLG